MNRHTKNDASMRQLRKSFRQQSDAAARGNQSQDRVATLWSLQYSRLETGGLAGVRHHPGSPGKRLVRNSQKNLRRKFSEIDLLLARERMTRWQRYNKSSVADAFHFQMRRLCFQRKPDESGIQFICGQSSPLLGRA